MKFEWYDRFPVDGGSTYFRHRDIASTLIIGGGFTLSEPAWTLVSALIFLFSGQAMAFEHFYTVVAE